MGTTQSFPLADAFHFVRADRLDATLEQAILAAPMFGDALALERVARAGGAADGAREEGAAVPAAHALRRPARGGLSGAGRPARRTPTGPLEVPDHPLVRQTVRDCLYEAMDTERLRGLLERIERGEIRLHARDTTEPSPFSHEILNAKPYAFLDDAPLEERRARAVSLRRTLPEHQRDLGALDPDGDRPGRRGGATRSRATPTSCTTCCSVWSRHAARGCVARVVRRARARPGARPASSRRRSRCAFATERARTIEALYPGRVRGWTLPAHLDGPRPSREDAVLAVVRGHAEVAGPFTAGALAARLGLEEWEVAAAVAAARERGARAPRPLRRDGRGAGDDEEQFCDRRLLARIHRYTLDRLRAEIEPVSAQDF